MKIGSGAGAGGNPKSIVLLSIGLLVTIALALAVFVHVSKWQANDEAYLLRTAQLRVIAQQIAKGSLSAAAGDQTAFGPLKEARDGFQRLVDELKQGVPAIGLPATPAGAQPQLRAMETDWLELRQYADDILNSREAVLSVQEYIDVVTEFVPKLEQYSREVVDLMVAGGASSREIAIASNQATLVQRIDKNVAKVLVGGDVTTQAIEQFGRDADLFGRVLEGMLQGSASLGLSRVTDPAVEAKLREVAMLFSSASEHSEQIIEAVPEVIPVLDAAGNVTGVSDKVDVSLSTLLEAYGTSPGRIAVGGIQAGTGMISILGAVALVFLVILGVVQVNSSKRREAESNRQNERNQQAILRLLDEMGNLADGDLTVEATVTEDVTGAIADSINFAIEAMRGLVTTINETAVKVSGSAQESRATAMHLAEASEHQAEQITKTTSAIKEMTEEMDRMTGGAADSAEIAQRAVSIAGKGGDTVRRTINGMDTIREQIQETSKRIKRLGESSQEIGDIVELIDDIADQTNILALNAAMQAAMAGEAGRGFAVVADEVQRLAERSSNATKQIEALVKTIQADTNEAVISMESTTSEVVSGAQLAEDAGVALKEIETVSQQIEERISGVADSAKRQSDQAARIDETMSVIQEITVQTSDGTRMTARSIGDLANLAEDLQRSVAGFRLPA